MKCKSFKVTLAVKVFAFYFKFSQNPWFRKSRFKSGKGKKPNIGGGGLGYKERPGLGAESSVSFFFFFFK